MRQFLGLANYYHRFVPGFTKLTNTVTDVTRKGASDLVQWRKQCRAAFVWVKEAFCGKTLLHTPNFSLLFILQTSTLNRGLGSVLTREVRRVNHPIMYISWKL